MATARVSKFVENGLLNSRIYAIPQSAARGERKDTHGVVLLLLEQVNDHQKSRRTTRVNRVDADLVPPTRSEGAGMAIIPRAEKKSGSR
jgi:hypothetical protein